MFPPSKLAYSPRILILLVLCSRSEQLKPLAYTYTVGKMEAAEVPKNKKRSRPQDMKGDERPDAALIVAKAIGGRCISLGALTDRVCLSQLSRVEMAS